MVYFLKAKYPENFPKATRRWTRKWTWAFKKRKYIKVLNELEEFKKTKIKNIQKKNVKGDRLENF